MATNKRKEAAALFELIDKSTLKIPKNAGALKIPSWWSSRSNPPANGEAPAANDRSVAPPPPAPSAAPQARVTPSAPAFSPSTPAPPPAPSPASPPTTLPAPPAQTAPRREPEVGHGKPEGRNGMPVGLPTGPIVAPAAPLPPTTPAPATPQVNENSAQQRLFEPPPAHVQAMPPTPSIRPPAPQIAAPVSPPVKAPPSPSSTPPGVPAPAPVASEPVAAAPRTTVPVTEAISENELQPKEAVLASPGGGAKPFAPQTHAQPGRKLWTPPRAGGAGGGMAGVLARVPSWALLAGAAGVVIILCLLVVVIRGGFKGGKPSGGSTANSGAAQPGETPGTPSVGGGLIPPPGEEAVGTNTPAGQIPQPQAGGRLPVGTPNVPGPAPVSPMGRNPATPGRVYQPGEAQRTPGLQYLIIAQTPELKIAERNAEALARAGIDVSIEHMRGGLYGLVSVQGFRSSVEGESLRRKVIEVGRQFPGKGWGDAYFTNVRKPAGSPAAQG